MSVESVSACGVCLWRDGAAAGADRIDRHSETGETTSERGNATAGFHMMAIGNS